jgi:hypothetical protein
MELRWTQDAAADLERIADKFKQTIRARADESKLGHVHISAAPLLRCSS